MGLQRLPRIPLGQTRLEIIKTKQADRSAGLIVEFKVVDAEEALQRLIGTKCARVFKFGGDAEGQSEARAADWCRFVCAAAKVEDLDALAEKELDPFVVLDESADETLQPLVGEVVDCETIDTGKVTQAKAKYKGGDPIHNNIWSAVADEEG